MIDGMIVREMYRRCMFDQNVTARVANMIIENDVMDVKENKLTEMVRTLWSHYEESGFLSVRILDYLQPDNIKLVDQVVIAKLIQSLPMQSFELVSVHDCFRCHPNYGNNLRRQYNQIMCDIKNSNMLNFIACQVVGKKIKTRKVGHIPDEVILNGNYLLS